MWNLDYSIYANAFAFKAAFQYDVILVEPYINWHSDCFGLFSFFYDKCNISRKIEQIDDLLLTIKDVQEITNETLGYWWPFPGPI